MNFFQTLFQMMTPGVDYNLTVSRTEGKMTLLVLPKVNGLKDGGAAHIIPFTMTGTPDEIDRSFFPALQAPLTKSTGVLTNMKEYEDQADKAASKSKSAADSRAKEDKAMKEKREKYDKHIKKAEELIAAKDYKGAMTSLQQARLHAPGDVELKSVDEKTGEINKLLGAGSLFDLPEVIPVAEQKRQAAQPEAAPSAPGQQPQPEQPVQAMPQQGEQMPPAGRQQQPYPHGYPGQMPYGSYPGQQMQQQGSGSQNYEQPYPGGYPQGQGYQHGQPYPQNYPQQGQPYPGYNHQPAGGYPGGEGVFRPEDYAGIPDVEATHVGQMFQHQQQ